jgi:hypothetical protein
VTQRARRGYSVGEIVYFQRTGRSPLAMCWVVLGHQTVDVLTAKLAPDNRTWKCTGRVRADGSLPAGTT